jgi:hypothetical protein
LWSNNFGHQNIFCPPSLVSSQELIAILARKLL